MKRKIIFYLCLSSVIIWMNAKVPQGTKPTLSPCPDSGACISNKIQPGELKQKGEYDDSPWGLTKRSEDGLKKETEMGNFSGCDYPTFYNFRNQGDDHIVVANGKKIGLLIRIHRESCDVHKESEAVEILYKGEKHYAVTGFDGNPVFLYRVFFNIVATDSLWCVGLPSEPSRYHTCKLCGKIYASQEFKSQETINGPINITNYYSHPGQCPSSQNKNHDDLVWAPNKICGIQGKKLN